MPWVYIARCRDDSLYVGSTAKDPDVRVWEHNNVDELASEWTVKRRPIRLVYVEEFDRVDEAFLRERQLHGWGRAKKLALIAERGEELPGLSHSRRQD